MTMPVRTQEDNPRKADIGRGNKATPPARDRQALPEGLNHDLAGEYQAILMYTH